LNSLWAVTNQPSGQSLANTAFVPPSPAQQFAAPSPVPQLPGLMPGHGLVRVNIQGSLMTSSVLVPNLLIDGRLLNSRYGVNAFQVPGGRHRVELYAQWMRRYGQAALDVEVPVGESVEVFYAAPLHQFTTGNIGLTKQRRKGMVFFGLIMGLIGAMIIAMMVLIGTHV